MAHYDAIVIGGGTMGTAAAWELGKRGLKALVLEQFEHVHTKGAHSGETRIIRHAYAEGPDYVPLVFRADDLWMELEALAGELLFHRVGAIELSAPGNNHAALARESAIEHGIPFEWLAMDDVRSRYPQFAVGDDWVGGFGDRGGFLDVERSLRAMASQARSHGVEIREHAKVEGWSASDSAVTVSVDGSTETADRLIITAGSWTNQVLGDAALPLRVLRKTLFWLEVDDPARYTSDVLPVYIIGLPHHEFYGFPIWGRPGIKVAIHSGGDETNPDSVDREISAAERDEIVEVARIALHGVTGRVLHEATCLYTVSPDHDFIVDFALGTSNVVIGAGFSGHGFKFTPAIGELLVQMLYGEREPLPLLSRNRFVGAV
ncbi:MAG TPA: N-methyl-L-tryptophan oxidase [Thermomicrobiales bacterium]|nr:N-methyl-L-tryptophan oxidase [Thermomicrobiales bacterium]